jgi:hypothetical protein
MYSAADYVEMSIIYGECGNELNPHALFSRAFYIGIDIFLFEKIVIPKKNLFQIR